MAWTELSLNATPEAVDWVNTLLGGIDYQGEVHLTAYDSTSQSYGVAEAEPSADWAFTVRLYLPYDSNSDRQEEEIAQQLSSLARTGLTTELERAIVQAKPSLAEQTDAPIHQIGERFVILTPDAPYQSDAHEIPLRLKDSLAFGSGTHPATILSLRLLERHITPTMNTLDLGSGSGILSVAMAKLGATVLALDNDQTAVQATYDAVQRNGVESQVTVQEGSLGQGSTLGHWMGLETIANDVPTIQPTDGIDLIMANVLARVHIALANDFRQTLQLPNQSPDQQPEKQPDQAQKQSGLLITAGFTTDYEQEVNSALLDAGFEAVDAERMDEWVALVHRLPL
ncbi:MAG: 50S ribosomal protein L11 methyltransferase [Elainellaceae cyanobacterium]